MAQAPKKTAAKPAANKPAAAKAAAERTAAAATRTTTAAKGKRTTARVKITRAGGQVGGQVSVAVNGKVVQFKTGQEIEVSAEILEALQHSDADISVIQAIDSPDADTGDSTVERTAIRGEDPVTERGDPAEPPAPLRQVTDEQLKTSSQEEGAKAAEKA